MSYRAEDTGNQILAKLIEVDGVGSGLDADLLHGESYDHFLNTFGGQSIDTTLDVIGLVSVGDITNPALQYIRMQNADGTADIGADGGFMRLRADGSQVYVASTTQHYWYENDAPLMQLTAAHLRPQSDAVVDLGNPTLKWKDAYVDNMYVGSAGNEVLHAGGGQSIDTTLDITGLLTVGDNTNPALQKIRVQNSEGTADFGTNAGGAYIQANGNNSLIAFPHEQTFFINDSAEVVLTDGLFAPATNLGASLGSWTYKWNEVWANNMYVGSAGYSVLHTGGGQSIDTTLAVGGLLTVGDNTNPALQKIRVQNSEGTGDIGFDGGFTRLYVDGSQFIAGGYNQQYFYIADAPQLELSLNYLVPVTDNALHLGATWGRYKSVHARTYYGELDTSVTALTQSTANNSTKVATTAFVQANIALLEARILALETA